MDRTSQAFRDTWTTLGIWGPKAREIVQSVKKVSDIIAEIAAARVTERGSRADDKSSEAAMEDRKKQGYF